MHGTDMNLPAQTQTGSLRFVAFHTLLGERRSRAGLSFDVLAKRMGTSPAHLHRLEKGEVAKPGRDFIIRLGIALGDDVDGVNELLAAAGHQTL